MDPPLFMATFNPSLLMLVNPNYPRNVPPETCTHSPDRSVVSIAAIFIVGTQHSQGRDDTERDYLEWGMWLNNTLQVYPPPVSELDKELAELVRENGALDGYVKAKDQQRAAQMSISVLSTLDFLQESNNTDVSKLRFQKYRAPIMYNMYILLVLLWPSYIFSG